MNTKLQSSGENIVNLNSGVAIRDRSIPVLSNGIVLTFGWSAEEIAAALVDRADYHMLALAADIETNLMIEEVQR